jgi:hypothetical protein
MAMTGDQAAPVFRGRFSLAFNRPARATAAGFFLGRTRMAKSGKKGGKRAAAVAAAKRQGKEDLFFAELAMVCNVSAALSKAGMTRQSSEVYRRRLRDPEFRARWDEAVGESYAMLELEMLARGRHGEDRPAPKNEAERRVRELTDAQALNLLRLHKSGVKGRAPHAQRPMRGEKLAGAIEQRLSEISRRLGGIG